METIGDLDCIVCAEADQQHAVREQLTNLASISWDYLEGVLWQGRLVTGMEIELSVCTPNELGTRLIQATGSKPHICRVAFQSRCIQIRCY